MENSSQYCLCKPPPEQPTCYRIFPPVMPHWRRTRDPHGPAHVPGRRVTPRPGDSGRMSCDLTPPWGTAAARASPAETRSQRGWFHKRTYTEREPDVITIPTRYALHSYAKLGAARSWVFTTARQLTPWDAYFGFNSTYIFIIHQYACVVISLRGSMSFLAQNTIDLLGERQRTLRLSAAIIARLMMEAVPNTPPPKPYTCRTRTQLHCYTSTSDGTLAEYS